MRAFVALELPPSLREKLAGVADLLRARDARVRWVDPERMHLTLKFLGEVDEATAGAMEGVLERACEGVPPLRLGVGGLGAFPNRRNPRVLWVGLERNEALERFQRALEEGAAELGVERDERPFRPHLTLGRVKYVPRGSELLARLKSVEVETSYATADRATLFESTLTKEGPLYRPLHRVRLRERGPLPTP